MSLQYYDKMKKQEVLRSFRDLFPDNTSLRKVLNVDIPDESDYGQRILTKLKYDILREGAFICFSNE